MGPDEKTCDQRDAEMNVFASLCFAISKKSLTENNRMDIMNKRVQSYALFSCNYWTTEPGVHRTRKNILNRRR